MIKGLLFRLDDIAPGLKRENLSRLEVLFDKYSVKPLIGVVPDNRDDNLVVDEYSIDEFWANVKRLQDKGWVVTLHGFNHVYTTETSGLLQANPFSEFAGIDYDKQFEMIKSGKEMLEQHGLEVKGFMAPGHTFDLNTLKALRENGFSFVTDGYTDYPYIREGLKFVPCTTDEAVIADKLDTMCIHLNNWNDDSFSKLEEFLKSNSSAAVSWEEVLGSDDAVEYSASVANAEKRFIKIRDMKRRAAESDTMQRYLQKSYSDKKIIKLIKRALYLPMLLKK